MPITYSFSLLRGSIHDHGTWGIMIPIRGSFVLQDWMVIDNNNAKLLRNYVLSVGSLVQFDYIEGFDWHRSQNMTDCQAVSLHLYGKEYNNDTGEDILMK